MQDTQMFSKFYFVGKCRTTAKTIPNPMLFFSVFPEPAKRALFPGPKVLALITFKLPLYLTLTPSPTPSPLPFATLTPRKATNLN